MKFESFQDKAARWRWRYVARNNRIIATSGETFASRFNSFRALHVCYETVSGKRTTSFRVQIYTDVGDGARWRIRAANGRILAVSHEAFASRANARRAAYRFVGTCQREPPK